ncbi:MAG: hypothetical protein II488_06900 [Firmicutes bacterium]|nr:hypothetical protein [Bacillota bacterium]
MAEIIPCRGCQSPDCKGCNVYILSEMLHEGKLDALMNENHTIKDQWLGVYEPGLVEDGTYVVKDSVLYKLVPKVTYYPGAAMCNVLTGETHYPTNYAMVTNLSRDMLARFLGETAAKWCDFEDKTEEEAKHFREWLDEEVADA